MFGNRLEIRVVVGNRRLYVVKVERRVVGRFGEQQDGEGQARLEGGAFGNQAQADGGMGDGEKARGGFDVAGFLLAHSDVENEIAAPFVFGDAGDVLGGRQVEGGVSVYLGRESGEFLPDSDVARGGDFDFAANGLAEAVLGGYGSGYALIGERPILGRVYGDFVLGKGVSLDANIGFGDAVAVAGGDFPHAEIGFGGQRHGYVRHSEGVRLRLAPEYARPFGVLNLDRDFAGERLEVGAQAQRADADVLAGLVDGLVGFDEYQRSVHHFERRGICEGVTANGEAVVAGRDAGQVERDGLGAANELGGAGDGGAVGIPNQLDAHRARGGNFAGEQGYGDALDVSGSQLGRGGDEIAVGVNARRQRQRGEDEDGKRPNRVRGNNASHHGSPLARVWMPPFFSPRASAWWFASRARMDG